MTGPDHGIHPRANGAGKGQRLDLREVDQPPVSFVPRVFVRHEWNSDLMLTGNFNSVSIHVMPVRYYPVFWCVLKKNM
ncbi:unnamed protein product [Musa hybrid cultivar]